MSLRAGGDLGGYIEQVPSRYTGWIALPVMVDLHGHGVSAANVLAVTQLGTFADRVGFITITPQVPSGRRGSRARTSPSCGVSTHVESTLCIDQSRLFVLRDSNGAVMTSVLACMAPPRLPPSRPGQLIWNFFEAHPLRP